VSVHNLFTGDIEDNGLPAYDYEAGMITDNSQKINHDGLKHEEN
jgi:hypothetical protein